MYGVVCFVWFGGCVVFVVWWCVFLWCVGVVVCVFVVCCLFFLRGVGVWRYGVFLDGVNV